MSKQCKITVLWRNGRGEEDYWIVKSVVNSIEFRPGQSLNRKQLEEINLRRDWTVTVVG